MRRLHLSSPRDGLLFVPSTVTPRSPAPVVMMLHGAGGVALHGIAPLQEWAAETGTILVAPESRSSTWDFLSSGFGEDVRFLDRVLNKVFSSYTVDPAHVALAGFSDGASYALSVGLANGDLFTHLMAFSPGFMAPPSLVDSPKIFVAHGLHDRVLPINACSRRLVRDLTKLQLEVAYQEFQGDHAIPADIARQAFEWLLAGPFERRVSSG